MAIPRAPRKGSRESREIPAVEWVAAAIGMFLVALALGTFGYHALWGDHSPPDIVVEVESISSRTDTFLVQFTARNRGGSPAEGVVIEGSVGGDKSQITLDYLAGHSERQGGLYIAGDPKQPGFRIRALGYGKP